jgi:transposase
VAYKIIKGSRLPNRIVRRLIHFFALEVPAFRAARELGIHRHGAERIYSCIRTAIVRECEREAPLSGEVEVDESYFGGQRKGNRGRGAAGKVAVFGLFKRNGRVYTRPVPEVRYRELFSASSSSKKSPGEALSTPIRFVLTTTLLPMATGIIR